MLMSDADEINDKPAGKEEDIPTASFDGSVKGPGGQIGPFRIERELGRGAVGVVYLAHDTKLNRPVAIKSLPAEVMENSKAPSRFSREARLLASLNHPNIATIYDEFQETEDVAYLILEYVPGQTLGERIAKRPLKLEEALSIALQIAEAVAAAHEHDVIHRDLKPGNIKITPEGKVKVLDFGLAKAVGGEAADQKSTVTEPGRVIGTPAYMSPEQARGKPADKRSDIWSFGCVLYEMLAGRLPFRGETISDTLANILQTEPNLEMLPRGTPDNIVVLLRRCLEKDLHRRLQHIGDASIEIDETLRSTAAPITTASSISVKSQIARKAKLRKMAMIIGAVIIVVLSAIALWFISKQQAQRPSREKVLVVLPFENLGSAEDEYFAAGITDAITARLAVIRGLGVISRQSAMQYKKREKNTRQIAKELGVDYILEGTVQRERPSDPTSRVRIIPQLIRASDDTHVWAQTYDNDMSEVFAVQSDLAEQVAQALDITLLEPERKALASRPTQNMGAYDYYLRGDEYLYRGNLENDFKIAIQMYEKAVELDPMFAQAYAGLSEAHVTMYWFYYDRSEERLATAKQAADKAFQLNPNLPEAHLALGWYYYHGHLDYDRALEEFAIARKIAVEVGGTLVVLRKYPEAERYYDRGISLAPDWPAGYNSKAWLYLCWEGSIEKARAVLEEALQNTKLAEDAYIVNSLVMLDVFDGNYQEALDRLSLKSEDINNQFRFIPTALRYARIYGYMKKKELEQAYYDSARSILESKIQERMEDERFHSSLGIAYAGLGRKEDAIREGKLGVKLLPVTKEAYRGLYRVEDLAKIYVMVGEFDAAIDQLEFLLSHPGPTSIPLLRLDPAWGPLRDQPRFKRLLEEGSK
jgi:serine/threonine protein kinase/tetratricopeptide (TPR) repeat protein